MRSAVKPTSTLGCFIACPHASGCTESHRRGCAIPSSYFYICPAGAELCAVPGRKAEEAVSRSPCWWSVGEGQNHGEGASGRSQISVTAETVKEVSKPTCKADTGT